MWGTGAEAQQRAAVVVQNVKSKEELNELYREGIRRMEFASNSAAPATAATGADRCQCGNTFLPDAKFCKNCGRPREVLAPTGQDDVCACGNALLPDARFCRKCGRPRAPNACAAVAISMLQGRASAVSVAGRVMSLAWCHPRQGLLLAVLPASSHIQPQPRTLR